MTGRDLATQHLTPIDSIDISEIDYPTLIHRYCILDLHYPTFWLVVSNIFHFP